MTGLTDHIYKVRPCVENIHFSIIFIDNLFHHCGHEALQARCKYHHKLLDLIVHYISDYLINIEFNRFIYRKATLHLQCRLVYSSIQTTLTKKRVGQLMDNTILCCSKWMTFCPLCSDIRIKKLYTTKDFQLLDNNSSS